MDLVKKNIWAQALASIPKHYYRQYFTIDVLTTGNFYIETGSNSGLGHNVYYSKNGGLTWTLMPVLTSIGGWEGVYYISCTAGEKVQFKSDINSNSDIIVIYIGEDLVGDLESGMPGYGVAQCNFNCYGNIMSMFYGDDFIDKPSFPPHCACVLTFAECINIKDASNLVLPAIYLNSLEIDQNGVYNHMFYNSSVTKPPQIIPAILDSCCYQRMFSGCKNLTGSITIPKPLGIRDELTSDQHMFYDSMFSDTSAAVSQTFKIEVLATMDPQIIQNGFIETYPSFWNFAKDSSSSIDVTIVLPWEKCLIGCSHPDYGDIDIHYMYDRFDNPFDQINENTKDSKNISSCTPVSDTYCSIMRAVSESIVYSNNGLTSLIDSFNYAIRDSINSSSTHIVEPLYYFAQKPLTIEPLELCTIKYMDYDDWSFMTDMEFSLDGTHWQSFKTPIQVPAGSKVSFKAIAGKIDRSGVFDISGKFNAFGNIMSLQSDTFSIAQGLTVENEFMGLFERTKIVDAENLVLPAITLTNYCYKHMFYECTELISPPAVLPVKNPRSVTGCYESMFELCKKMSYTPELLLTSLYDYDKISFPSYQSYIDTTTICKNMCKRMYYDCLNICTPQRIHVQHTLTDRAGTNNYDYMYALDTDAENKIPSISIYSHSTYPGNWSSLANSGGEFNYFASIRLGGSSSTKIVGYFNDGNVEDVPLDNIQDVVAGNPGAGNIYNDYFINLYDGQQEDQIEYYITVIDETQGTTANHPQYHYNIPNNGSRCTWAQMIKENSEVDGIGGYEWVIQLPFDNMIVGSDLNDDMPRMICINSKEEEQYPIPAKATDYVCGGNIYYICRVNRSDMNR